MSELLIMLLFLFFLQKQNYSTKHKSSWLTKADSNSTLCQLYDGICASLCASPHSLNIPQLSDVSSLSPSLYLQGSFSGCESWIYQLPATWLSCQTQSAKRCILHSVHRLLSRWNVHECFFYHHWASTLSSRLDRAFSSTDIPLSLLVLLVHMCEHLKVFAVPCNCNNTRDDPKH